MSNIKRPNVKRRLLDDLERGESSDSNKKQKKIESKNRSKTPQKDGKNDEDHHSAKPKQKSNQTGKVLLMKRKAIVKGANNNATMTAHQTNNRLGKARSKSS